MKWVLLVIVILLLLGPLRTTFFRNWRFTLPACILGLIALMVMQGIMGPSDPWWMKWAVAAGVALGAGTAGKEWLDGVFGKRE